MVSLLVIYGLHCRPTSWKGSCDCRGGSFISVLCCNCWSLLFCADCIVCRVWSPYYQTINWYINVILNTKHWKPNRGPFFCDRGHGKSNHTKQFNFPRPLNSLKKKRTYSGWGNPDKEINIYSRGKSNRIILLFRRVNNDRFIWSVDCSTWPSSQAVGWVHGSIPGHDIIFFC